MIGAGLPVSDALKPVITAPSVVIVIDPIGCFAFAAPRSIQYTLPPMAAGILTSAMLMTGPPLVPGVVFSCVVRATVTGAYVVSTTGGSVAVAPGLVAVTV